MWCGVDLGSTNVKVLFLADDGRVAWRESRPTPRVSDGIGACSDGDATLDLVETMMLRGHRVAGLNAPLAGVAVGGTGEDGVPVDAALRPLDLAIPWFDRRADAVAARMAAEPVWRDARLPVALEGSRTAAKWAWLRAERPETLAGAASWIALTDYPAARWSGRAFMSESLAARTACYDIFAREWVPGLLKGCGAPEPPPVVAGGTVLGGLRSPRLAEAGVADERTLVVAGGHDHPMAAFAIRRSWPDAIIDSMGTAELLYGEVPGGARPESDPRFGFSRPIRGRGIACLGVLELSAELTPLLADGAFRAVMAGERVPGAPADGSAMRAVLEACAWRTRGLLNALHDLGVPPGPLFATGGWARSDAFLELRASVLGQPIHVVAEQELSAFGAALLARGEAPVELSTHVLAPDADWAAAYAQQAGQPR